MKKNKKKVEETEVVVDGVTPEEGPVNANSRGGAIVRSILFFALFMFICGFLYTVVVTGIAQGLFPNKANGSQIEVDGKTYGSELLAQEFTGEEYLWGRIMIVDVTSFEDEDGNAVMYASASNSTPTGDEYDELVEERVEALLEADPTMEGVEIPEDLVTVSGSGLDPEISPEAAEYQVHRIAEARGITEDEVREAIEACTKGKFLGIFGNERVNVLKVNLILDGILDIDDV